MFCPKCGQKVEDGSVFCMNCGMKLDPDSSMEPPSSAPEMSHPEQEEDMRHAPAAPENGWSYTAPEPNSAAPGAGERITQIVGKNPEYYLPQFEELQRGGKSKINWASFFLGLLHAGYRNMWREWLKAMRWPLITYAALCVGIVIGVVAFMPAFFMVMGIAMLPCLIWMLVVQIRFACRFNQYYLLHVEEKIARQDFTADPSGVRTVLVFLAQQGCIAVAGWILSLALVGGLMASLDDPELDTWDEFDDDSYIQSESEVSDDVPYDEPDPAWEEQTFDPLTSEQLSSIRKSLGVPDGSDIFITQSDPFYWEGGECWLTHVTITSDGATVAGASVDASTGELVTDILTYSPPEDAFYEDGADDPVNHNTIQPEGELSYDILCDYVYGLTDAINTGDFSYVSPVLLPGSQIDTDQRALVQSLYGRGITEEVIECSLTDYFFEDDMHGAITSYELIGVTKADGSYKEVEQSYTYFVQKQADGSWMMYDMNEVYTN